MIDQIFSRIDSGTNYRELTDRLGSVRDVINNAAVFKDTIGYGGIASETESSFRGRYAWTGREIDTEMNLQYNRARCYDAGTELNGKRRVQDAGCHDRPVLGEGIRAVPDVSL